MRRIFGIAAYKFMNGLNLVWELATQERRKRVEVQEYRRKWAEDHREEAEFREGLRQGRPLAPTAPPRLLIQETRTWQERVMCDAEGTDYEQRR